MANENPYKAPSAEVRDPVVAGPAGGTLEGGISGDYDFEIMEVIKEAWQRQSGMKGAVWLGLLLSYLVVFGVSIALGIVSAGLVGFGGQGAEPSAAIILTQVVFQLAIMAIMYPMYAGLFMIGIYRSVDMPVGGTMVFGYFGAMLSILLAMLLVTIFSVIGFLLLVIPGIYLSIAYSMTMPLIAEKKLGFWSAMEASRKAVTKHWLKYFLTFLLMGLILGVSMLALFIGLIWTVPMMIAVFGILYRITFGVEEARETAALGQAIPAPAQA
jgi:uncharacterized membrane protein